MPNGSERLDPGFPERGAMIRDKIPTAHTGNPGARLSDQSGLLWGGREKKRGIIIALMIEKIPREIPTEMFFGCVHDRKFSGLKTDTTPFLIVIVTGNFLN